MQIVLRFAKISTISQKVQVLSRKFPTFRSKHVWFFFFFKSLLFFELRKTGVNKITTGNNFGRQIYFGVSMAIQNYFFLVYRIYFYALSAKSQDYRFNNFRNILGSVIYHFCCSLLRDHFPNLHNTKTSQERKIYP